MSASKNVSQAPHADVAARPTQALFETAMAAPQKLVEANVRTSLEIFDFVCKRMKAQADFYDTLSHCKEVGQIVESQQQFWNRASKDYAEEAGHLVEVAQENVNSLASALNGQATRH
jgi:hypothetical protein